MVKVKKNMRCIKLLKNYETITFDGFFSRNLEEKESLARAEGYHDQISQEKKTIKKIDYMAFFSKWSTNFEKKFKHNTIKVRL